MTMEQKSRFGLLTCVTVVLCAAWLLIPPPERVQAACNSVGEKRFEVSNLRLGAYTNDVFVQFVPTNVTVTFRAEFDTTLPSGDSASFTCNWSGVINKGLIHPVVPGYNKEEVSTNFMTTGVKTETFSYDGKDWSNEYNTCQGTVTTNLTVVTVEYDVDHVCTTGVHAAYHDVVITVNPNPPGTTINLELRKESGTSGAAKFTSTGTSTASISGSTTVTILGTRESDIISNMVMEAKIGSTVYATDKFTVVDVRTQKVTEVLHTINTTNDATQVDDTHTVWVCQTSTNTATVTLDLSWMPETYPKSEFWWQAMVLGGAAATEWGGPGTFDNNPANITWTPGNPTNREFQIRTWFDCDKDDTYLDSEPHRIIDVKVVDFVKLELKNTALGTTVADMTRPDESQGTNNTLYLGETTNGTAEMQIQGWWLPGTANNEWFRWRITMTNDSESDTTQWLPVSTATFATNPVTVIWTNRLDTNGQANRAFKVRGWYDCNKNNQYDADEPHRLLYVCILRVDMDIDVDDDGDVDDDDEAKEESPGVIVFENWDNDDGDAAHTPDKDETSVTGENDLVPFYPKLEPTLNIGTLKLETTAGGSRVKVWTSATKGTEITLPKTWNLAAETVPTTLYLEGYDESASANDVELKLSYANGGSSICDDKLKITVVRQNLGVASYRALASALIIYLGGDFNHAGLITRYTGTRTKNGLTNDANWVIVEMDGSACAQTTLQAHKAAASPFHGFYSVNNLTDVQRNNVVTNIALCHTNTTIGYTWMGQLDGDGIGLNWDGTIGDIDELRCDGLVEVCYELAGIEVWGQNGTHYLIQNFADEHDNLGMANPQTHVSPIVQRGGVTNSPTHFISTVLFKPQTLP